jgi:hypothetical protein
VLVIFPVSEISKSISSSVGMNGSFAAMVYFGAVQVFSKKLRKAVYVQQKRVLVLLFHLHRRFSCHVCGSAANQDFTSSGSVMLQS